MILVVTRPNDPPVARALAELARRGVPVMRFDPARLATDARLTLWHGRDARRLVIAADGSELDLDEVDAVWYRRPNLAEVSSAVTDPGLRDFVREETNELWLALWDTLDCPFVSSRPSQLIRAGRKPWQLAVASRLGLEIAPTCITTDPAELVEFYRANDGRCIGKLIASRSVERSGLSRRFVRYTEPVTLRDLGHAQTARHCPTLLQAYVPKSVELRITVVGTRVFAAAIDSQRDPHARHDWRHARNQRLPFRPYRLPADIEASCVALLGELQLAYGAIDMIVTPDGRHVFIEINPNGEYDWVEHKTGLPITAALCDLLAATVRRPARRTAGAMT